MSLFCVVAYVPEWGAWCGDVLPTWGGELIPFESETKATEWITQLKTEPGYRDYEMKVEPYPEEEE